MVLVRSWALSAGHPGPGGFMAAKATPAKDRVVSGWPPEGRYRRPRRGAPFPKTPKVPLAPQATLGYVEKVRSQFLSLRHHIEI
jgi:hypothetical protein